MNLSVWLQACRPKTLPAAMSPVMVAGALAWHDGLFDVGAVLLCLVFALLVQIGTNFANDYFDFIKGADNEKRLGPKRVVAAGLVAPLIMWRATLIVLTLAFVVGLLLIPYGGVGLLVVGVASIVCAIAYTGGPYPLGYKGWGDVFVILFFGMLAVMITYYVQTGLFVMSALLCGLACGLVINNILVVNNYRDYHTDKAVGKNTLVVRFGRRFARWQYGLSYSIALMGVPLLLWERGMKEGIMLPVVLLPVCLLQSVKLKKAQDQDKSAFNDLLGGSAKIVIAYSVLLIAGILL